MFLFLNVKGTRPMTYQYLTLEMIDDAKRNAGFVEQKKFETADHYVFIPSTFNPQVYVSFKVTENTFVHY